MTSAPLWSNVKSYGVSSRDSHNWSHVPSAAMRYTAPFGVRRSSRGVLGLPVPPDTSTTEIEVISADTDGTGAPTRIGSAPVPTRLGPSSEGAGPPLGRPLR